MAERSKPASLHQVDTPKIQQQAKMIKELEELLVAARAGELESLVWFTTNAKGSGTTWGSVGACDQPGIIGRLDIIKHTVLTKYLEGTET